MEQFKYYQELNFLIMVYVIIHHILKIIMRVTHQIIHFFILMCLSFIFPKIIINLLLDHNYQPIYDFL